MNKSRIRELEAEIENLREQIDSSGTRESRLQSQLSSAKAQVDSVIQTLQMIPFDESTHDGTLEGSEKGVDGFGQLSSNTIPPESIDLDSCFSLNEAQDLDSEFWVNGGSISFPIGDSAACNAADCESTC